MRSRLTGRVEEVRHGRWRLIVNLPPVHTPGVARAKYPKKQQEVDAGGVRLATSLLNDWIAQLEQLNCTDPDTLTLEGLLDQWLASIKPPVVRPATWEFYDGIARRHLKPKLGTRIAGQMKRIDFTAYLNQQREEGMSETTLTHHIATLSSCYSWAVEEELYERNPLSRFKGKPVPAERRPSVWDDDTIAQAVVLSRGTQTHAAAVLGGWCGLRPSETCAVRWEDADLASGVLTVCRSVEETDDGLREFNTKKNRVRFVPLPSAAVAELEQLLAWQEVMRRRSPGWNRDRRIVCRLDGEQITPSGLASMWAGFVRRRGLPRLSLHGLRHSYATISVDRDGIKVAQAWLGHAKESTTMVYHQRTNPALVAAIARLEQDTAAAVAKAQESLQDSRPIRGRVVSLSERRAKNTCK